MIQKSAKDLDKFTKENTGKLIFFKYQDNM